MTCSRSERHWPRTKRPARRWSWTVVLAVLAMQMPATLDAQSRGSRLDQVFTGLAYRPLPAGAAPAAGIAPAEAARLEAASPHDERVRYRLEGRVLRSVDGGASWSGISPELAGGAGASSDAALTTVAESPLEPGLLWVGTSDGRLHLTRDGGETWNEVSVGEFAGVSIRSVEPSVHEGGRAYLVAEQPDADAPLSLVFRTDDYGASTWTPLSDLYSGLPQDEPATVLREDPVREDLLFAGTPDGVYVSFNGGSSWDLFQFGLPDAAVTDMRILGRDLVVDLEGLGPWVMDEIAPLRQVVEGLTTGEPYLFAPSPIYLAPLPDDEGVADGRGAIFDYLLPSIVRVVTLEVVDDDGRVLVGFRGVRQSGGGSPPGASGETDARQVPGTRAGVHRIVWDLTTGDRESGEGGQRVAPGNYLLRMNVDGLVRERTFEVVPEGS
jgi:hypothetical protein